MNQEVQKGRIEKRMNGNNPWMTMVDEPTRALLKEGEAQTVYIGFFGNCVTHTLPFAQAKRVVCGAVRKAGGVVSQSLSSDGKGYIATKLTKKQVRKIVAETPDFPVREDPRFLNNYRTSGKNYDLKTYACCALAAG